ncbi:MAG: SBBP repeat-containing protein [Anaerolineae bacterium]
MNDRAAAVSVRPRIALLGPLLLLASAAATAAPIEGIAARAVVAAPLRVIPNRGQWPAAVLYRADTATGALFVTGDGITRVDIAADRSQRVRRTTIRGGRFVPGAPLPGVTHYLRGADRARWVRDVPAYDSVTIVGAGPGPTAAVRVAADTLNRLAAGPAAAAAADVATSGDFAADVVPSNDAASDVGAAVVDAAGATTPTLAYSTYLGGRLNELARGIAVDAEGSAYVVGTTTSIDFPVAGAAAGPGSPTAEPLQPTLGNGGSLQDAFVTKLDPTGTRIVWSTYLGGIRQDEAFDVAVDGAGRAHVTGYTSSPDFPTARAVQPELHLAEGIWSGDAFVARLSADGGDLEVGTFFGGTGRDVGKGIALGADGSTYVTGWTGSNLPAVNAVYPLNRGVRDAFIAKYTPDGDRLAYTTHLGGADADEARDIAVDGAGNAYIAGSTISLNLRTAAPFQSTLRGESDAFVARLNAGGTAFDYATYLGGRGTDEAIGIAVDAAGGAVVLGRTTSPDFPRADALQSTRSGPADLFVTRLAADGGALVYSTFLGGNGDEGGCVPAENYRDLGTPTPDGRGIRYLEGSKFTDGPAGALSLDPEAAPSSRAAPARAIWPSSTRCRTAAAATTRCCSPSWTPTAARSTGRATWAAAA